jgi:hypothetical protein
MYALHHTSRRNEAHIVNLRNGKKQKRKEKKEKVCGQMPAWRTSHKTGILLVDARPS